MSSPRTVTTTCWTAIGHYLAYVALRVAICVVQAAPLTLCQSVVRRLAWLFADFLGVRRRLVDDNLRQAFPESSAAERAVLARRMWEHLFLFVVEVAHAPRKIHRTNWRDYFVLRNPQPLVELLLAERPLLLVSGHYGNFELAGYALGLLGFPTYAIARTLDNPFVDRFVGRFRGATGQHIIPKKGGYDEIVAALGRSATLSFLADQHAGDKGCWVDFFGRPASTHKAIALFSLGHRAPLAVTFARRLDAPLRMELVVDEVFDPATAPPATAEVRRLTQWFTRRLEAIIRRAPDQYWWLHRRWRDPPRKKSQLPRAA